MISLSKKKGHKTHLYFIMAVFQVHPVKRLKWYFNSSKAHVTIKFRRLWSSAYGWRTEQLIVSIQLRIQEDSEGNFLVPPFC